MTVRRGVSRTAVPIAAGAVAAVLVLGGYLGLRSHRPDDREVGRWGIGGSAIATAPQADPFATREPAVSGTPTRLRVKAIGVDTALETLRLDDAGALVPPREPARAGWYADGTAPGEVGPAIIAGHVDGKGGPAVFYRLRELDTGDTIEVVRGGTTLRFTVVSTAWYPKNRFPTDQVYGPTPDRQLRLITCGGVFDRSLRSYRDNLVVYAVGG